MQTEPSKASGATVTPLQRQLRGERVEHRTAMDALTSARAGFQAGQRLDMNRLAAELGINRATLYRWVGSREQLLCEVLWSLTSQTLERAQRQPHDDPTRSRLAVILADYNRDVMRHKGMRKLLETEGEFALRLLTVRSGFQLRLVTLVGQLIDTEAAAGRLEPTIPTDDLAFIVVRIIESYVYRIVITGEEPDAEQASRVLHALLPPPAGARPVS